MRITISSLALAFRAGHAARQRERARTEHPPIWRLPPPKVDKVSLSPAAQVPQAGKARVDQEEVDVNDLKALILKMLLEEMGGEELDLFDAGDLVLDPGTQEGLDRIIAATAPLVAGAGAPIQYDRLGRGDLGPLRLIDRKV